MPIRPAVFLLFIPVLLASPAPALGQVADSVPTAAAPVEASSPLPPVKLWHFGAAIGGTMLISVIDDDVQRWVMEHRTETGMEVADAIDEWGGFYVPAAVAVGGIGLGLIIRKPEVTRTGARVATSVLVASGIGRVIKRSVGRARPSEADDQYTFDPFSDYSSFPSGHTLTAFALSTTLADAIDNTWADVGLYGLAAGTGVARVVQNHHWASDVVGGALLGLTVAKFVDGRWSLFGLESPELLTGPQGAGLRWTADLPGLRR